MYVYRFHALETSARIDSLVMIRFHLGCQKWFFIQIAFFKYDDLNGALLGMRLSSLVARKVLKYFRVI